MRAWRNSRAAATQILEDSAPVRSLSPTGRRRWAWLTHHHHHSLLQRQDHLGGHARLEYLVLGVVRLGDADLHTEHLVTPLVDALHVARRELAHCIDEKNLALELASGVG